MYNDFLYDEELSLKAKGLLATIFLLGMTEADIDELKSVLKEDKTQIKSTLLELYELGYVEKLKINGNFKYKYVFHDRLSVLTKIKRELRIK